MDATKIIAPAVHLNGTDRTGLVEQYTKALEAVNSAVNAMSTVYPHGRDYYILEPGSYGVASEQHNARVRKLVSVRDELFEILKAVRDV